jgi:SAM-dependent methyltransferase
MRVRRRRLNSLYRGPAPIATSPHFLGRICSRLGLFQLSAMSSRFDPSSTMIGGYLPLDGTIEFYGRINFILKPTDVVLDLGAGRGAWFTEERCSTRRQIRELKPKVRRLIGVDVDPAVLSNPSTNENYLVEDGKIPLPSNSVDVIIADYVLEHVLEVNNFAEEIDRVLRPGGFFCARTPHRFQYVSIVARFVRNTHHSSVLRFAQRTRKKEDIFPTAYRLNTIKGISAAFPRYDNYSYLYASEPFYYFESKLIYALFCWFHRILPKIFVSNLFAFLRKPN